MKNICYQLFVFIILFFISCSTTNNLQKNNDFSEIKKDFSTLNWETISPEINYSKITLSNKSQVHILKIDFSKNNLELFSTEISFPLKKQATVDFCKKNNCIVAINASPFSYVDKSGKTTPPFFTPYCKVEGIIVEDGNVKNPPNEKYDVFVYNKTGFSLYSQREYLPQDGDYAIGGFWTILTPNGIIQNFKKINDNRTVIGFSLDSKWLYFMAVEGPINFWNSGTDFETCAYIMKELGADYAIQLDGGHSTSFVISDYKKKVKNLVNYFFLTSRLYVANNIGIRYIDAIPLE